MADVTRAQLSILDTNEPYVPVHINTLIVLLDAAAMELDEENIWCEETEALADALLTLFVVDPHVAQAVFERLCAWRPEVSDVLTARKEAKETSP